MSTRRYPYSSVSPEEFHKWLSALICVLNSVYFLLNMAILQKLGIGGVQLTVAVFGGYCFYKSSNGLYRPWHSYTLLALLTLNILLSIAIMELVAGATYWGLALPFWYYSLFGLRKGFVFSAVIVLLCAVVIFLRTDTNIFMPYRTVFNFTLVYCSIWLVCHIYEVQRQKTSAFLHSLALQDDLTNLKNRHALKADFRAIHKNFQSIHMLIIDIDHFKHINDKYGHDIGDTVLTKVADLLMQSTQVKEIYRLGGEEFVILLKDISDEEAQERAEKIRKTIELGIFFSHNEPIKLTVSIGISSLRPEHEFTDFLRSADEKLYQAKHEGRNRVCC
ncbi:GGDEF domain-containing protein [Marinomonas lutimaris]|jgi:diguanylate cyclase|uniref:GGDEF domain-containing protein n=1 Tax=Marinomonas lutimaris TaxID=2846746 RepID=UPI001C6777FB|nr:GGDEF domain-containing protein [Marinomonas lutimaris]